MNQAFLDHYRCPEQFANFSLEGELSQQSGYFRFGDDTVCYGRTSRGLLAPQPGADLQDVSQEVGRNRSAPKLPFDPSQIVENLRRERYLGLAAQDRRALDSKRFIRDTYYLLRPLMSVAVRRPLQRIRLRGWEKIRFPSWPVDRTVEQLMEGLMGVLLKDHKLARIPFIWFWPEGYSGCLIVTHDVETRTGLEFCPTLMDIDDSYGIKSSFQLIPEGRYDPAEDIRRAIRDRGFELNLHDLSHDGHLFRDRGEFLDRAARINAYAVHFGARGFRSGSMYRNLDWYESFRFSYDMSVPNVAHLDPQRGGCCTVMPYFIGQLVELPLTTTQDYALFHFLRDYSLDLWKRQMDLILTKNGLASFIIHPDYIVEQHARGSYLALLDYLSQVRSQRRIWMALPGEVDTWWRERSQLRLVPEGDSWRIAGPHKERARVGYAYLEGDQVRCSPGETASPTGYEIKAKIVPSAAGS